MATLRQILTQPSTKRPPTAEEARLYSLELRSMLKFQREKIKNELWHELQWQKALARRRREQRGY